MLAHPTWRAPLLDPSHSCAVNDPNSNPSPSGGAARDGLTWLGAVGMGMDGEGKTSKAKHAKGYL